VKRARIVEQAPAGALPMWAYVLIAAEGAPAAGVPLLHTWGRAAGPDEEPDPVERHQAIEFLTMWAAAHGWTTDAPAPEPPPTPQRIDPAAGGQVRPSPPSVLGRASILLQPTARRQRKYWYDLTVVDGPLAAGTRLRSATARRGFNPHGDRPIPDPVEDERARATLRAWAADNGWIVLD
jgi:hypothetical protein